MKAKYHYVSCSHCDATFRLPIAETAVPIHHYRGSICPGGASLPTPTINRYRITFYGRTVGAIGIDYEITAERDGATFEAARLALYDKYEHVHVVRYVEVSSEGDPHEDAE